MLRSNQPQSAAGRLARRWVLEAQMSGLFKFQKAILAAAQQHWMPLVDEHREELGETIKNHIFDLHGPRHLPRRLNAREQYFSRIFYGFTEIFTSLDTLDDIAFYVRRFPFEGTRITRERYLQFHVESHYSEIYVLRERLYSYITIFRRQFRRDPQLPDVEKRCDALTVVLGSALAGVVGLRGRHIHRARFSDDAIDRLSTIGLLSRGSDSSEFSILMRNYYREEHKNVRGIWRGRMRENVKAIRQLLDAFFEALLPMVFDPETEMLRYPRGIRT